MSKENGHNPSFEEVLEKRVRRITRYMEENWFKELAITYFFTDPNSSLYLNSGENLDFENLLEQTQRVFKSHPGFNAELRPRTKKNGASENSSGWSIFIVKQEVKK